MIHDFKVLLSITFNLKKYAVNDTDLMSMIPVCVISLIDAFRPRVLLRLYRALIMVVSTMVLQDIHI